MEVRNEEHVTTYSMGESGPKSHGDIPRFFSACSWICIQMFSALTYCTLMLATSLNTQTLSADGLFDSPIFIACIGKRSSVFKENSNNGFAWSETHLQGANSGLRSEWSLLCDRMQKMWVGCANSPESGQDPASRCRYPDSSKRHECTAAL